MKKVYFLVVLTAVTMLSIGCSGNTEVAVETPPMSEEERQSRDMVQQLMNQRPGQGNPLANQPPAQGTGQTGDSVGR